MTRRPPPGTAWRWALALAAVALIASLAAGTAGAARRSDAHAVVPRLAPTARERGMVMRGLRYSGIEGICGLSLYEIRAHGSTVGCTHGPDMAPAGIDVAAPVSMASLRAATAPTVGRGSVPCSGNGTLGDRVQVIYGHPKGHDRFKTLAPLIRTWTTEANDAYNASAAETGGSRQIRFVTGKGCVLSIQDIAFPASGVSSIEGTISYLHAHHDGAANRKYLVWMDAHVYCGIGELIEDGRPAPRVNLSNGPLHGEVARVDTPCWPSTKLDALINGSVAGHEITHTLGAVQPTAPLHSKAGHCVDEYDQMCYVDAPGVHMRWPCSITHQQLLDCDHNNYFSTAAPKGSYLNKHWNSANSSWLIVAAPANDSFANAEPVVAGTGTYVGSTVRATAQAGEPATAGFPARHSIWYTFTTPATAATVTVDTQGSGPDTVLGVYSGSNVSALTPVATNDDNGGGGTWSLVSQALSASRTYHIKVDAKSGSGPIHLHVGYSNQPAIAITSISPTSGPVGTTVTVHVSSVPTGLFSISVDGFFPSIVGNPTSQELTLKVPGSTGDPSGTPVTAGASGPVVIRTPSGYAISRANFTVTH